MKLLTWLVVLIVALAGAFWFIQDSFPQDVEGRYVYMCENGVEFTMEPSADLSTIRIAPMTGASFPPETLLSKMESSVGSRFEHGSVSFFGIGEDVVLTVDETTLNCGPKPDGENAPWSWGDRGEEAGAEQNLE